MILVSQLYDHPIVYMSQIFFNIKELASWSYHQGFAHWAKSPRQINAQSIDCHGWPIVGEIWLLDRLTFCILQFFSTTFAYDSNNIYTLSLSLSVIFGCFNPGLQYLAPWNSPMPSANRIRSLFATSSNRPPASPAYAGPVATPMRWGNC